MYKVIDNFLDKKNYLEIKDELLGNNFPWFLNLSKNGPDHPYNLNDHQFVHIFYNKYFINSEKINIVMPIVEKINPVSILRIKANITSKTEKLFEYGFHVDTMEKNSITCVYYVNSNNGKTLFKNGESVDSIENRLLIFDSDMPHTATSCTDEKIRCVINFNFIKDISLC